MKESKDVLEKCPFCKVDLSEQDNKKYCEECGNNYEDWL